MKTNVIVSLDTRRKRQDGSYPLILRLGHNERTTSIPTGIFLLEKDWDEKNRVIKKSHGGVSNVTRLNNMIQKKRVEAMDIIFKLHEANQIHNMPITELRERIVRRGKALSFYAYTQKQIEELRVANRNGTARSYKGVINVLKTFDGDRELRFSDITFSFLNRFEIDHKSRGNGVNGLAVYMRTIRSIYNKAIKEGIVEKELYPFSDYKIRTAPTKKRALEWDYFKKIISLQLKPDDPCFNARNYFVASYMMYGMNFSDMAYLRKIDIQDGRIVYQRRKTNKIYDVKVTDNLQSILSYYLTGKTDTDYIFPIIRRESSFDQEKDIQWARKRYNSKLKEIARRCGIEKKLTSYVSRHSFATQAMLQDVPLNAISTMLGHSSLKTTETYLQGLPSNILDKYHLRILQHLEKD